MTYAQQFADILNATKNLDIRESKLIDLFHEKGLEKLEKGPVMFFLFIDGSGFLLNFRINLIMTLTADKVASLKKTG